jgi:hypothetical protein
MARAETRLRARLKLPASLIDRTQSNGKSARAAALSAISTKKITARKRKAGASRSPNTTLRKAASRRRSAQ